MNTFNYLFKRVNKIRLQGPLDVQIQQKLLNQMGKITPRNSLGLIMIINSYGGSLRVAKNISQAILNLRKQEVPVYCFAEQYCLNSANLILTAGTKAFVNKFSIFGDFGYVYENYDFEGFTKKYNIGLQKITNAAQQPNFNTYGKKLQLKDKHFIEKLIKSEAEELKSSVFENRGQQIRYNNINKATFEQKMLVGGSIQPQQAIEYGLIDGLSTYNSFLTHFSSYRVKQQKESKEYQAMNFVRNTLQVFKQES